MNFLDYAVIFAVAVACVLCVIRLLKKPSCHGDCAKCDKQGIGNCDKQHTEK